MNQQQLFTPTLNGFVANVAAERDRDIDARFEAWLAACPDVWPLFLEIARKVKAAGYKRYSADAIGHQIRWHFQITRREAEWKMNDHFTSRLARKLMREHAAEFEGFFELRQLRAVV